MGKKNKKNERRNRSLSAMGKKKKKNQRHVNVSGKRKHSLNANGTIVWKKRVQTAASAHRWSLLNRHQKKFEEKYSASGTAEANEALED